jgi:Ca2+-binding EF-hand superfamily protein
MNTVGTMLLKIDPKVQPILVELIDPEGAGYTRKDRYMKAMKAVSLFMAVDKDMSHSLSKSEMSTLLWLMCGDEPNDNNLNGTLSNLDANGDSAIELREWMDFLATNDHKGKKVLNYSLKQKFDLYDDDGNGNISVDELENMIIDSFQGLIDRAKGDNKIMAENVVRDLAKIIMNKMDDNMSNNLDVNKKNKKN